MKLTIDDLAQAAALAVKQDREGTYLGAWNVANSILNPTDDIKAHRDRIVGIKTDTITLANNIGYGLDFED